nr:unnamed protein product [Rangifer tarandus platyrhynchus]
MHRKHLLVETAFSESGTRPQPQSLFSGLRKGHVTIFPGAFVLECVVCKVTLLRSSRLSGGHSDRPRGRNAEPAPQAKTLRPRCSSSVVTATEESAEVTVSPGPPQRCGVLPGVHAGPDSGCGGRAAPAVTDRQERCSEFKAPFHREPETGNGSSHPADVTGGCDRRRRGLRAETEAEAWRPAFLWDVAQFEQIKHRALKANDPHLPAQRNTHPPAPLDRWLSGPDVRTQGPSACPRTPGPEGTSSPSTCCMAILQE